jgi:hypothetical protein
MLSRHGAFRVSRIVHHELVHKIEQSVVERCVRIAWHLYVHVQVAITNVAVRCSQNLSSFFRCEGWRAIDKLSGLHYTVVVVLGVQRNVVNKGVAVLGASSGDLLSDVPNLARLLLIVRNNPVLKSYFWKTYLNAVRTLLNEV